MSEEVVRYSTQLSNGPEGPPVPWYDRYLALVGKGIQFVFGSPPLSLQKSMVSCRALLEPTLEPRYVHTNAVDKTVTVTV